MRENVLLFWTIFIYFLFRRSVFYLYRKCWQIYLFFVNNIKKKYEKLWMFLGVMKMLNNNFRCFKKFSCYTTRKCIFFCLLFIIYCCHYLKVNYVHDLSALWWWLQEKKGGKTRKVTFVFHNFPQQENNPFICWN